MVLSTYMYAERMTFNAAAFYTWVFSHSKWSGNSNLQSSLALLLRDLDDNFFQVARPSEALLIDKICFALKHRCVPLENAYLAGLAICRNESSVSRSCGLSSIIYHAFIHSKCMLWLLAPIASVDDRIVGAYFRFCSLYIAQPNINILLAMTCCFKHRNVELWYHNLLQSTFTHESMVFINNCQ